MGEGPRADDAPYDTPGLEVVHAGAAGAPRPLTERSFQTGLCAARPSAYPARITWLTAGVTRVPAAALAAFAVGAYNLSAAIWLAAIGAFLGLALAVLTALVATAHSPAGAVAGLTVLAAGGGLLAGAVAGVGLAVVGPAAMAARATGMPAIVLLVLQGLPLLLFAGAWIATGLAIEPWLMRLRGYRRMSRRERELILPLAERCARALGLRSLPRILVNDSRVPDAFAAKRHIVVNRGVYDVLRGDGDFVDDDLVREELGGLLAHELWHWRNADAVGSSLVFALAFPVTVTYYAGQRLHRLAHWLPRLAGLLLLATTFPAVHWLVLPLYGVDSRRVEYECDRAAVRAGFGRGLYRLLSRLQDFEAGDDGSWRQVLARSHPPVELRLEALERAAEPPSPRPAGPARS